MGTQRDTQFGPTARLKLHRLIAALSVILVFCWMVGIQFLGGWQPGLSLVIILLYLTFSALTVFGLASAIRVHWILGLVAGVVASPLFVWHFREIVRRPDDRALVPLACGGAAIALFAIGLLGRRLPLRQLLTMTAVSVGLFTTLLGYSYSSLDLRWSLLNKQTVFGFPVHMAIGPQVKDVEMRLWNERAGGIGKPVVGATEPLADESSPSVVFVMLDTLRRDALGVYGGNAELMPELDRFALGSAVFEDVLANASWTRPSIASMFTGLYQEYHGAVGRENLLSQDVDTVAEVLARRGYETAAFVTNWGAIGRDIGFAQGFEFFSELRSDAQPYARADQVTGEVMGWLSDRSRSQQPSDRPLFLYVHYLDPHTPYLSGGADSTDFERARQAYENELAFLDRHLAELLQFLEGGIDGPVVTVIASDHGEEFGDHGQKGHGYTVYQEVARVPLIVRTPRGEGANIESRLEGRDLYDLILAAAGSEGFDPVVWARSRDRSVRYTSEYLSTDVPMYRLEYRDVCIRAMERDGRLLIWSALGPTMEVYDRVNDPLEKRNLGRDTEVELTGLISELDLLVPAPWVDRDAVALSSDTMDQLRALGYVH